MAHPHKREAGPAQAAIQELLDEGEDWREILKGTRGYAIYIERELGDKRLIKIGASISKPSGTSLLYPERFYRRGEWESWISLYDEEQEKADCHNWWYSMACEEQQAMRNKAEAAGVDPYGDMIKLYRFQIKWQKSNA